MLHANTLSVFDFVLPDSFLSVLRLYTAGCGTSGYYPPYNDGYSYTDSAGCFSEKPGTNGNNGNYFHLSTDSGNSYVYSQSYGNTVTPGRYWSK